MNRSATLRLVGCLVGTALAAACLPEGPCTSDSACPTGRLCAIAGDRGACYPLSTDTYTLGGSVSGLTSDGLVLTSPGQPDLPVAAGATQFKFPVPFLPGSTYAVTVKAQPSGLVCTVDFGVGAFDADNISFLAVRCTSGIDPSNTVAVNFTIDATGRPGFYANGDLEWKGNFSYDAGTRVLTPNTGWAGPYVPLYDDGSWIAGGHEPMGSTAGDDKFGIRVLILIPTTDLTIEYGAQTKEGGWIWPGANGSVTIPANSTAEITADGLVLAPEGDVDLRLLLDTTALGGGGAFSETPTLSVKGTMSDWMADPAFDDGTHGDALAGDHIWTYTLSSNIPRRLLLTSFTNCEFVWEFHPVQPDGGVSSQEYKYGPNNGAGTGGVSAKTKKGDGGWVDTTVQTQTSTFYNTYVTIP